MTQHATRPKSPAAGTSATPMPSVSPTSRAASAARRVTTMHRAASRSLDVAVAGVALLATSPLVAAAMVAVRRETPGGSLFRQQRVGLNGRPFTLLKIRTMAAGNDDSAHRAYVAALQRGEGGQHDNGLYKITDDPRVTRSGRWLRKLSIDELPQLWNVIRGDMSIVGPRPMLPHEVDGLTPFGRRRHHTKPGITGLWQVSGRSRLTYDQMIALDVDYAEHPSLLRDLRIIAKTPRAVLGGTA